MTMVLSVSEELNCSKAGVARHPLRVLMFGGNKGNDEK